MKKLILKKAKLFLGLVAALALPSCLQNETTITLNKDGSGTIVDETMLSAQMAQSMTQFAQPGQPDPIAEMFSEEKAKAKAAKIGEGVEYVKTEIIENDGKRGARVHYKFTDINKISINPGAAMESLGGDKVEAEEEKDEDLKFAYEDGKLKIIVPPSDFEDMAADNGPQDPQQEAMMMQAMADMRLTVKLVIADGIAESTASHVDGNTVTLFDIQVDKMFTHKDELKKIAETSKTDIDAAKAAFSKLEGIKIETKEDATVTIK